MKCDGCHEQLEEVGLQLCPACNEAMWAATGDLGLAAVRVRAKFGRDEQGKPLDWTEWRDLDDALQGMVVTFLMAGPDAEIPGIARRWTFRLMLGDCSSLRSRIASFLGLSLMAWRVLFRGPQDLTRRTEITMNGRIVKEA